LMALGLFVTLVGSPLPQFNFSSTQSSTVVHAATSLPTNTKDGAILHAFDWSFNTIKNELPNIASAGFNTIQVSPAQGTKDSSTDPTKWWLLYQPTNQSVGNSQLGSESDFKALCTAAHSYGIKIIVDVVMNHVANNGNADQWDSTVDPKFQNSSLYHNQGQCTNWNGRWNITQQGIGMPDLNTQNSTVQSYALSYLNQLVADGADGFRYDTAKHIETNIGLDANQSWAGSYWTNTLGSLSNRSNLFAYGEVLQDGTVDNISAYESFLNGVTASNFGGSIRSAVTSGNLSSVGTNLGGVDYGKAITFVETHDTYEDGTSKGLTDTQRKLGWAIAAGKAGATPLFFDRPTGAIGTEGDALWKDKDIAAINNFHNAMAGQSEYLRWTNNNSTMLIDRGTIGTIIINDGSSTYVSSPTNLASGTYTNQGSANCTLTVSNGTISGNIPANSVIVLYNNPTPVVVSTNPTTATAGSPITITYDATNRALAGAAGVNLHWGYDNFTGATDTAMTSLGNNKWQVTVTVPTAAKSNLNFYFTNGTTTDNNGGANWSVTVSSPLGYPHAGYKVDYDSSTLVQGKSFTVYYSGSLVNSSTVKLHWGINGFTGVTDTTMTKDTTTGFWSATITIPSSATKLDFDFTDGTNWDNNSSKDWHLQVWSSSVPVQVSPAPVATKTTTVYYNGTLASSATSMTLHWGYNSWVSPTDVTMTKQADGRWSATITVPSGSYELDMAFKNNAGTWDSNNSANYIYSVAQ
ncbi:MAG: carbohydrate-binding protein, partial [Bacillota bacterium]|nr:carbohydrate-binding protein [Bacillota bacterium]